MQRACHPFIITAFVSGEGGSRLNTRGVVIAALAGVSAELLGKLLSLYR